MASGTQSRLTEALFDPHRLKIIIPSSVAITTDYQILKKVWYVYSAAFSSLDKTKYGRPAY